MGVRIFLAFQTESWLWINVVCVCEFFLFIALFSLCLLNNYFASFRFCCWFPLIKYFNELKLHYQAIHLVLCHHLLQQPLHFVVVLSPHQTDFVQNSNEINCHSNRRQKCPIQWCIRIEFSILTQLTSPIPFYFPLENFPSARGVWRSISLLTEIKRHTHKQKTAKVINHKCPFKR